MPNLPQSTGPMLNTLADVNSRVRSIVNDDNAQLWPDGSTGLLNACRDAYNWLYGQIVRLSGGTFRRVIEDIAYTPTTSGEEQDLVAILPADMYFPRFLEFRLNTGEQYAEINRVQRIPSRNTEQLERPTEWEKRGHTIIVASGNQAGLLKLTYDSLVPTLTLTTDQIVMQNAIEALAHYAASELFRRRGQMNQMQAAMGDDGSRNGSIPFGAKGFASLILDHIVLDEQDIPRRGVRFTESSADVVSNRQYTG